MAVSCCKQAFYNFDKFFFLAMCYFACWLHVTVILSCSWPVIIRLLFECILMTLIGSNSDIIILPLIHKRLMTYSCPPARPDRFVNTIAWEEGSNNFANEYYRCIY